MLKIIFASSFLFFLFNANILFFNKPVDSKDSNFLIVSDEQYNLDTSSFCSSHNVEITVNRDYSFSTGNYYFNYLCGNQKGVFSLNETSSFLSYQFDYILQYDLKTRKITSIFKNKNILKDESDIEVLKNNILKQSNVIFNALISQKHIKSEEKKHSYLFDFKKYQDFDTTSFCNLNDIEINVDRSYNVLLDKYFFSYRCGHKIGSFFLIANSSFLLYKHSYILKYNPQKKELTAKSKQENILKSKDDFDLLQNIIFNQSYRILQALIESKETK